MLLCPVSGDVNIGHLVDMLICLTPPLAPEALLKVKEGLSLIHPGIWYLRMWRCREARNILRSPSHGPGSGADS